MFSFCIKWKLLTGQPIPPKRTLLKKTSGLASNGCSLREARLTSHSDLRRENGLENKIAKSYFFLPNGDLPLNRAGLFTSKTG